MKIILLLSVVIVNSTFGFGSNLDLLPGSRTVYVPNHPANETIRLMLRKCQCGNDSNRSLAECSFCGCWKNSDSLDQPAIQGDPRVVLTHSLIFDAFFPGFGAGRDSVTNHDYIEIPSPKTLKTMLKLSELDNYFEMVDESNPIDFHKYLDLLAQGKIPIASLAQEKVGESNLFLYHMYFHDLFNHFFLWTAFPESLRNMVSTRVARLIKVFHKLEKDSVLDPNLADFLRIMKFTVADKFDSAMGTLNFKIFNSTNPFLVNDLLCNSDEIRKNHIEIARKIEATVNFGLKSFYHSKSAYTFNDLDSFTFWWLDNVSEILGINLSRVIRSKDINVYVDYYMVKKEPSILASIERLATVSEEEIGRIKTLIATRTQEIQNPNSGSENEDEPEKKLITAEQFATKAKELTVNLLEKFKGIKANSQKI